MSASDTRALVLILVAAAMTFATRAAPFVLFGRKRGAPPFVVYLGTYLPPAIMAMLVVYALRGVDPLVFPHGIPELLAVAVVVILHLWKREFLLSIFGGTAAYMILLRILAP